MWDRLLSDCRHALRALRRRPGYAIACMATMALVLGANTALFAAVNATLFRPIPLRHSERLVRLLQLPPGVTDRRRSLQLNEASLIHFRQSRTVHDLVSWNIRDRVLHVDGAPYVVRAADASAGLLALSPSPVVLGRAYTEAEDVARAAVMVLGWATWQQAFGGADDVIGRTVQLDGAPFEVIGVLPRAFPPHFMDAQVWLPLGAGATVADGGAGRANLTTLGVLASGFTIAQADAEIARLMEDVSARLPAALAEERAGVMGMRDWLFGSYRAPFLVLAGSMVLLLILACANLAGLALAQIRARAGEMRLRRALGGTRAGIVRLVLLEVTILNVAGAAAGLVVAAALLPLLMRIDATASRTLGTVSLDWRVAAYAFASALLVSLVAAAVPGLLAGEGDAARDGESTGRLHGGRGRERWRGGLLIVQTAVCLALLVSCGLLLHALERSASISPGFDANEVLTAQLRLSAQRHATPEVRVRVVEDVLDRIRALPGVVDAATGLSDFVPGNAWVTTISVGGGSSEERRPHSVQLRRVTPAYFRALRIPMLQGRAFDERDHLDSPPAIIVSRTFAERLLAGDEPLGREVERSGRLWTIVGVVEDVADVNLVQPPEPTIYLPWHQSNTTNSPVALVIRTNGDPTLLGTSVLRAVRELDPGLPVYGVQPLARFIADSLAPQRFRVALLAWLAAVGLILGAIGIAGLTAQTIGERMGELGVRLMLGADRYRLCASAVARQLGRVAVGCALGVGLALGTGRMAAALLPELRGFDAPATLSAAAILLAAAAAAAAIPASRVLRLDPARILRR
jgi:putative ABC transport system permease protein